MLLMTKTIENRFKKQEESLRKKYPSEEIIEALKERKCFAKYFTPWANWRWYGFQYYKELKQFYGIVSSPIVPEGEWGYFMISDIADIVGPLGMKVERDLYSTPLSYEDVMQDIKRYTQ
jgi:hypothetical protein